MRHKKKKFLGHPSDNPTTKFVLLKTTKLPLNIHDFWRIQETKMQWRLYCVPQFSLSPNSESLHSVDPGGDTPIEHSLFFGI